MKTPLTTKAQEVMSYAQEEAASLGQSTTLLHILIGIMRTGQGASYIILSSYGISLVGLRLASNECTLNEVQMADLVRNAQAVARDSLYEYAGVEHLLVAFLNQEGPEIDVLCERLKLPKVDCLAQIQAALTPEARGGRLREASPNVVSANNGVITCPHCSRCYRIDWQFSTQEAQCSECGEVFQIQMS